MSLRKTSFRASFVTPSGFAEAISQVPPNDARALSIACFLASSAFGSSATTASPKANASDTIRNGLIGDSPWECIQTPSLTQPAGGEDDLAGQPTGIVRGEERHDLGDIGRRPETAQRRQGDQLLLELAPRAVQPGGPGALTERGTGIDGVHPDVSGGQFLRQHTGYGIQGALAG